MDLQLQGKRALVMAASQGLGQAIAAQLVKEGVHVMLASRNTEKLAAVCEKLSALGTARVTYRACDITKADDIVQTVEAAAAELGGLDILINNSGGPKPGSLEQLTDADWYSAFELNVLSYVRLIRAALPHLKQQGGRIVNVASSSIKEPIPGLILSNTFRTGITGLTKTLAAELAPHGILINTVAPGRIATDRVAALDELTAGQRGISAAEVRTAYEQTIPLGRYGEPEEFANAVLFLVSSMNTYMTGQSLLIDGGMVKAL